MLSRKPLKLNATIWKQKELSYGWNSVNELQQWFMSPRQMEPHVLAAIMLLLSIPSFKSLNIQFPSRRMFSWNCVVDNVHMPLGPWNRLRVSTLRSSDASSFCGLITNPCWKCLPWTLQRKKGGRRNLSCGLSDDAQSLPLKSLRKGLGTPCKQRHYCLGKMVGLFITAPILTSSHTSPAETNFLWSKAAFCGARELSYLP